MADVAAACKQHGLLPFTTANRIHVVPPCTISTAEALEGLEMLDKALEAADRHYTGA